MMASATARGCSTMIACAACGITTTETRFAPNSSTSSLALDRGRYGSSSPWMSSSAAVPACQYLALGSAVARDDLGRAHIGVESRQPGSWIVPGGEEHELQILEALGLGLRKIGGDGDRFLHFGIRVLLRGPDQNHASHQLGEVDGRHLGDKVPEGMPGDDRRSGFFVLDDGGDIACEIVQREVLHRAHAAAVAPRLGTQHAETGRGDALGDRVEFVRVPSQ